MTSNAQPLKRSVKLINCTKCGEKIEEGQNFCGKCGASLINKCPKCDTINKLDNLFCSHCGVKLKEQ